MKKFKIEDLETISTRKQIAYEWRDKKEILFWELQTRFYDYNKRNTKDPIKYITNKDLKEFKNEILLKGGV